MAVASLLPEAPTDSHHSQRPELKEAISVVGSEVESGQPLAATASSTAALFGPHCTFFPNPAV